MHSIIEIDTAVLVRKNPAGTYFYKYKLGEIDGQ